MAEPAGLQAPRYGDDQSADVLLHVRPSEGAPSAPLLLHSRVLRKSEFFAARLSERWASPSATSPESDRCFKQLEITLDTCANAETYIRCIRLLYVANPVKDTTFNDVQEAVGILQVAAEILFHDCVGACMRYLEAVRWSAEDESAIRSCVASLQLQVYPELAFRLGSLASLPDNCSPADLIGDVLDELLTQVRNSGHARARDLTTSVLLANAQATSSPAFAAVNEIALHKELQTNWERLKVQLKSTNLVYVYRDQVMGIIRWLWDKLFTYQIADAAVKMFSEDQEIAQLFIRRGAKPFTEAMCHILVSILEALLKGEVVLPRSIRLGLVKTWLPVVPKLCLDQDDQCGKALAISFENSLRDVVETLPIVDQMMIFKIWIQNCFNTTKVWPDLSEAFTSWCRKLHEADNIDMVTALPSSKKSFLQKSQTSPKCNLNTE